MMIGEHRSAAPSSGTVQSHRLDGAKARARFVDR
jgi:hypothetical protein